MWCLELSVRASGSCPSRSRTRGHVHERYEHERDAHRLSTSHPSHFVRRRSGLEQIEDAAKRGIQYPEALAESLAAIPSAMGGLFEGDDYFVEFDLGSDPVVQVVHVVFRGTTTNSQPVLARLDTFGWTIRFP
jgi:hypothetical protein